MFYNQQFVREYNKVILNKNVVRDTKDTNNNYVDNDELTKAIDQYVLLRDNGEGILKPSDYIGESIYKICKGLSYKANFINYTYKDEMVEDAIIDCIKALKNFNSQYGKAFGYLTMIAFRAFLIRLAKEKKQRNIKHRYMLNMDISDVIASDQDIPSELVADMMNVYKEIASSNLEEAEAIFAKKPPKVKVAQETVISNLLNIIAEDSNLAN